MRWTLAEVAEAAGGRTIGDPATPVSSVSTDSRSVEPGALFVALIGERFDGHAFAGEARAAGATAVLVEAGRSRIEPRVEVEDTLTALRDLAVRRRAQLDLPVAAVTGSTGKTSTKELLAGALGSGTWGAPRSYNNEIGVPLTVLGTPAEAASLVLEVGSRGPGHIRWLAPAVLPDVAVITTVGAAHLETFGDLETVARAKWELVETLRPGGTAVLPADSRVLAALPRSPGVGEITFGTGSSADVRAEGVSVDGQGRATFELRTPEGSAEVRLGMAGLHQPVNAAAAAAAALALGRSLDGVVRGLEETVGAAWRMEVHRGPFTVVNDAYNANPASMEAAMRTVAAMPGRRLAVLGRMAELGEAAGEEHRRIGALARSLGFARMVVVGEDPGLAEGMGAGAVSAEDVEEALRVVSGEVRPGDVILIKGSRVVGLEQVAERLVGEGGP